MNKYRIISADSHVSVPGPLYAEFLPRRYRTSGTQPMLGSALTPRQRAQFAPELLAGPVGRLLEAQKLAEREGRPRGRPGGYDAPERLRDMDTDGVDAEVLYGELQGFYSHKDPEERCARVRAYNDALWAWCAADHRRLIPVAELPIDPIEFGVAELERIARMGYKTALIPSFPYALGLPPYWDKVYEPLFAAAEAAGIPLSMHVGDSKWVREVRDLDPTRELKMYMSLPPLAMAEALAGWLVTDIGERFPNLHFVLVEAGIGWIPYYLERLDTMHERHGWFQVAEKLPSSGWYARGHATFEEDKVGVLARDRVGVRNILWATDYPHPDSTWPESQTVIEDHFAAVSEEERRQIVCENAIQLYKLEG